MSKCKKRMTDLDFFKIIKKHLLTQKKKCIHSSLRYNGDCMYHNGQGESCAIGCLISDKFYSEELESLPVNDPWITSAIANSFDITVEEVSGSNYMFSKLQLIHDDLEVHEWGEALNLLEIHFTDEGHFYSAEIVSGMPT